MKNAILALLLAVSVVCPARAARLSWDKASLPSLGAWQSLTSADQAFGLSKRVAHLDQDAQPLVNVGIFLGGSKALVSEPASSPRLLGGLTVAVPGSLIDWALGTDWGSRWVPPLKTGLLCAYDLTRVRMLKVRPDFIGIGIQYPIGL